jgi:hypothetical protein
VNAQYAFGEMDDAGKSNLNRLRRGTLAKSI